MNGAVILAGGASRRMGGRAKFLLRVDDQTFLSRLISTFHMGGVDEIRAMLPPGAPAIDVSRNISGVSPIVLAETTPEPLTTLQLAMREAEGIAGRWHTMLVHPVDHPLVSSGTVARIIASAAEREDSGAPPLFVQPCHGGRGGHPLLIPAVYFEEVLRTRSDAGGLRQVLHADPDRVLRLEVDDPGVVQGINTPEEYGRLIGR